MKTITINVSEPVYREFQAYAKSRDRTASELIREAMETYLREQMRGEMSLRDLQPLQLGKTKRVLRRSEDLLGEMMTHAARP